MESQKPKIAMYARRPFGEKLNATFDFIKENWKPLLKYSTYLILPLCLIQALSTNSLMNNSVILGTMTETEMTEDVSAIWGPLLLDYSLYSLCMMVGMLLLTSLVFALVRKYNEREERLQGITLAELKPLLFYNIKKLLLLGITCGVGLFLIIFLIGFLGALGWITLVFTLPLLIACMVPLSFAAPIYLFENVGLMEAIKKSFRLGFPTWGGLFLIMLVMGFIGGILQGVTMMPWYIATIVKMFFAISDTGSETTISAGYSFILYLLGILQAFGAYLAMIFSLIGLIYQYGHASEVIDSVTVTSDIENFDKL